MNAGRDVERLVATWLAEEAPVSSPDSILVAAHRAIEDTDQRHAVGVPWRLTQMNRPALLGAAAAIAAVLIGGALLFLRPESGPAANPSSRPTDGPSVAPSAFGGGVGDLTKVWYSDRYGYAIKFPADWTGTPATRSWASGKETMWGDPALDVLQGPRGRLVAASQALAPGQSDTEWYTAYCQAGAGHDTTCPQFTTKSRPLTIGGVTGYVDLDGVPAAGGTILPGGPIFDAAVVANGRGYEFTLDGAVTRADFERLLGSIVFGPATEPPPTPTKAFDSPLYQYRMMIEPTWTVVPATVFAWDPKATDQTCCDQITVTGTDTTLGNSADQLGGQTYDQWLVQHHTDAIPNVPVGCDGGDPSTWPTVPVGDANGKLMQLCNAAEVNVLVGDRVFLFFWGNSTFDTTKHYDEKNWKALLKLVDFSAWEATQPSAPFGSHATSPPPTTGWMNVSSPTNGVSFGVPKGWGFEAATRGANWSYGLRPSPFSGDRVRGPGGEGFILTSQRIPAGVDDPSWYASYLRTDQTFVGSPDCALSAADSPTATIDGQSAYLNVGGYCGLAIVLVGGRAYQMEGNGPVEKGACCWNIDPRLFEAWLSTIHFDPSGAEDNPTDPIRP